MDELLTVADVAALFGISERRVRFLAAKRGVGTQVSRGTWIFRRTELAQLRPGRVGYPKGRARKLS